ncbi:MAG TPA: hypothetical protein QGH92_02960 [Candidatus Parcubacteria bacterium]|jgi:hypothetical protein|nr:hypothetical protein [Parcubacteria group bacterium]HJN62521.1 hypothetical protein [Candidatus Parcubacteria bacterium]|tara:strand:- start:623 stop:1000 length:378 start_codon:yes stop_codon:yes gene_type:complete
MTSIETLAIIFALLTLTKLIVVIIDPKIWMKFVVNPIYKNTLVATVVYAILLVIVGYYLLSAISIVEFGAVMLFAILFMGIGFLPYLKTVLKLKEEVIEMGIGKAWLSVIIWLVLALWILYSILI